MNLYSKKIPKYWFYQLLKTRKHDVSLVLVVESVGQIEYFDNVYGRTNRVVNSQEAQAYKR